MAVSDSDRLRRKCMPVKIDNIKILNETLDICNKGFYSQADIRKPLKLTRNEMCEIRVYLTDDIENLKSDTGRDGKKIPETSCENADSYTVARKLADSGLSDRNILVLNLANAVHPGGGVRRGARAQEEDLCRKSSLLISLESETAERYYDYNMSIHTLMGSDAVMITPNVEIIRDENYHLLDNTSVVSVMTCAAPNVREGFDGMTESEYKTMLYNRAVAMLSVAAFEKYDVIVMGAFGCGAFANDARVVADIFYKAIKAFSYKGEGADKLFKKIDFAVLDNARNHYYNFEQFSKYFG